MADSVDLGHLLLTLGIESEKYEKQLEGAKRKALMAANDIEKSFLRSMGGTKLKVPNLELEPTVNDSALTDLNAHLALKEQHFKQVQNTFDRSPLTVQTRADFRDIDEIEDRLNRLTSKRYSASFGMDDRMGRGDRQRMGRGSDDFDSNVARGYSIDRSGKVRYAAGDVLGRGGQYAPEEEALSGELALTNRKLDSILNKMERAGGGGIRDGIVDAAIGTVTSKAVDSAIDNGVPKLRSAIAARVKDRYPNSRIGEMIEPNKPKEEFIGERDVKRFGGVFSREFENAGERVGRNLANAMEVGDGKGFVGTLLSSVVEIPKTALRSATIGIGEFVGRKIGENYANEIESFAVNVRKVGEALTPLGKEIATLGSSEGTAAEKSQRIAYAGYRAATAPMLEKQKQQIPQSANLAAAVAMKKLEQGTLPEINKDRVVYVTGGFANKGGQAGMEIAPKVQEILGEKAQAIGFDNSNFDVKADQSDIAFWFKDVAENMQGVLERGYNKDSVRLAGEVYAQLQQNPQSKISLMGHSAGGLISGEAAKILEELGHKVELLTIGTPNTPFLPMPEDARNLMGRGDVFNEQGLGVGQEMVDVSAHKSVAYLESPEVQAAIHELVDGVQAVAMATDDFSAIVEELAGVQGRKLTGASPEAIKKMAEEYQVPDDVKAGFRASNLRAVPDIKREEEAEQITFFVGGIGGSGGKESDYMGEELAANLQKHHVVGVESPEFDVTPQAGDSVTSPSYLKRAYEKLSGDEDKDAVADRLAARAYAYRQQHPEKPINLVGQSGGGMVARRAADKLEQMGVADVRVVTAGTPHLDSSSRKGATLTSDSDKLASGPLGMAMANKVAVDSVTGHQQYFDMTQGGSAADRAKRRREEGVEVRPNPQVQNVLEQQFDRSTTANNSSSESGQPDGKDGIIGGVEKQIRGATYKFADGIVAVLEDSSDDLDQKVKAFMEGSGLNAESSFNPAENLEASITAATNALLGMSERVKKIDLATQLEQIQEILEKAAEKLKDDATEKAIAFAQNNPVTNTVDESMRSYRMNAIEERAVPLAMQRADEIEAAGKTRNSGLGVGQDTENLFIATSGYANAKGLAGKRIAKQLQGDIGEKDKAVYVRNTDSDIDVGEGIDERAPAIAKSLAKPNIRGYSKDAVEIAAQAIAAKRVNPEVNIKILGESGGGFAAEEATEILKMIGIKAEYLGVGTPDLVGRLDKTQGNKILSPDEALGEVTGNLAKIGVAKTDYSQQQIPGIKKHPYENYREKNVAELMNFIQGTPEPIDKEQSESMLAEAKDFQSLGVDKNIATKATQGDKGFIAAIAEATEISDELFENLQQLRRQLVVASEDTRADIEEAIAILDQSYIRTSPESKSLAVFRKYVADAEELYAEISQNPGSQSEEIAKNKAKEIEAVQAELRKKGKGAAGMTGAKVRDLDGQMSSLSEQFLAAPQKVAETYPSLWENQPTVATTPEPPEPQQSDLKHLPPGLQETASNWLAQPEAMPVAAIAQPSQAEVQQSQTQPEQVKTIEAQVRAVEAAIATPPSMEELQKRVATVRAMVAKANDLVSALPEKANGFMQYFADNIGTLEAEIDELINSLDPADRTGSAEGNQAAQLKSQLSASKTQAEQNAIKEAVRSQALTSGTPEERVKLVGKTFSQQSAFARNADTDSADTQKIARDIGLAADQAKQAIDELLESMGDRVTPELRRIAGTAKGQITKAQNSTADIDVSAVSDPGVNTGISDAIESVRNVGRNVPEGAAEGIAGASQVAADAAAEMSQDIIDAAEDVLDIQSPSKVFERIGKFVGEGFSKGIGASMSEAIAAQQEKVKQAAADFFEVERTGNPLETAKKIGTSDKAKELAGEAGVAIAGTAASMAGRQLGGGSDVAAAAAEFLGTIAARQSKVIGEAAYKALQRLDVESAGVESGFARLAKLVDLLNEELIKSQLKTGDELTGDIAGFAGGKLGEIAASLIPGGGVGSTVAKTVLPIASGMGAGMGAVGARQKAIAGSGIGDGLTQGIAGGLKGGSNEAEMAAAEMAERVVEATKQEFEINSPSKVFERIGAFISEGLKKGISGFEGAEEAVKSSAGAIVSSVKNGSYANEVAHGAGEAAGNAVAKIAEANAKIAQLTSEVEAYQQKGQMVVERLNSDLDENQFVQSGEQTIQSFMSQLEQFKEDNFTWRGLLAKATESFSSSEVGKISTAGLKDVGPYIEALAAFQFLLVPAIAFLQAYGDELINAATQTENFNRAMKFSSPSSAAAANNIAFLSKTVKDLDLDLKTAQGGYMRMMSASRGTSMEGETTDQIFKGVSQASAVFGLDNEATEGTFLALEQVMGKGTVQAEELRGQLGERIPGAFQIAARAMGMTTSELDKMMSTGKVLSEDFLPKFAQQLASETSTGVSGAANTAQASLNRFNTALFEVQAQMGKPLLEVQKVGLNALAGILGKVTESAMILGQALIFFLGAGLIKSIQGIQMLAGALMSIPAVAGVVTKVLAYLGGTVVPALGAAIGALMVKFAIFSTLINLFNLFKTAISDTSGKVGEAADSITTRMEKYGETLDKVSGRSKEFAESLKSVSNSGGGDRLDLMSKAATGLANTLTGGMFTPVTQGIEKAFNVNPVEAFSDALGGIRGKLDSIAEGFTNIKAESLMESTVAGGALKMILGDELGTGVSRGLERGTQGALGMRTFAQKQAEDNIIQSGNVVGGANLALSEAYTMFGADGKGSAQIKQVQSIDSRLAQNSMERQALNPEDSKGKRDLEKIRDELLKERESANAAIATLQGVIAGNLEDLKSTKADLEAKLESGMFDTPENADNKRALQAQLAAVTDAIEGSAKAQDKFNELVKQSVSLVQRLRREYVMISAKTADTSANLDLSEAESRASLAQQKASGPMMTTGQSESADSSLALASLEQRLKANQEAMTRFQSILSDSAVTGALQTAGVSATAGAAETRAIAETLGEGDLQEYLNQAADAKEQLIGLQTDGARLQEQIAQNAADSRQRIHDLTREMVSFFQEIADQSAETSRTVKEQDITSSMSNAKAQLVRAVSKFGDEYFGSLTGSLIDMVEQLFAPLQELNNLQGQMAGFAQQARAGYEQVMQLGQQMPGATPGGAMSGQAAGIRQVATGTLAAQEYGAARDGGRRHAGQDLDYDANGRAQTFMGGTVTRVGNNPGGYGHYIDVFNQATGVVERIAEMDQVLVRIGDTLQAGQDVGAGTRDTGVIHYEIRTDANAQGQGGFGKSGTVDPMDFLEQQGVMRRQGNQLIPMSGSRPATTIAEEHHEGDGHDHGAATMPAARPVAAAPDYSRLTVKGQRADAEQIANARIIAETGQRLGATATDIQVAIATAIQESLLRNLNNGDADSLGIFQQRPSMDWGSREQIADPRFAAESFFLGRNSRGGTEGGNVGLLDLDQNLRASNPVAASHDVQRSGSPNAPAQWMNEAAAITGAIGSTPGQAGGMAAGQMGGALNSAGNQIGQNLQQLQQSAMSSYSAGLNLSDAQFEASINGATRQLQEVNRQIDDQVRDLERSQEDMRSGLEMDTPILQLTQQLRSIGRETTDRIREQGRQNESLSNSIKQYESVITTFEGIKQGLLSQVGQLEASGDQASLAAAESIRGRMEGLDQLIGEAQGSIDAAKSAQARLAEMNEGEGDLGEQRRNTEVERFVQGRRQEMMPAQLEFMRREGRGEEANNLEYQSQADELTRSYDASIRTLEAEKATAEARGESVEYLEQIRALTEEEYNINMSNLQAVRDRATAEAARAFGNESFQGDMAIGQARLEQGRALGGDTFGMRNAERDLAIAEQNNGLTNQLAEIQMAGEAAGRSAEQIQHLKDQATQLNDIRIDNLTTQFSEVPELLAPVQAGFEGFFTDIFSGTKSVGEAFQGMVSSILSSIASLVAKKLVMGIFGSLLGGGVGGGLGGGGGILSGLFGMKEGGEVPMVNMGNMRQGNDPVGMALRKEGSNSVLAALTPGEVVLTTRQAKSYFDLGMDEVLNFKTGGMVPGGGRSGGSPRVDLSGVSGNTTNVSVPISINSQGGDDQSKEKDRDLARKLKDPVESLVMQILQREKRYSGELYR